MTVMTGITRNTVLTRMIGMTRTGMTGMTWMARVTGMTLMARVG